MIHQTTAENFMAVTIQSKQDLIEASITGEYKDDDLKKIHQSISKALGKNPSVQLKLDISSAESISYTATLQELASLPNVVTKKIRTVAIVTDKKTMSTASMVYGGVLKVVSMAGFHCRNFDVTEKKELEAFLAEDSAPSDREKAA